MLSISEETPLGTTVPPQQPTICQMVESAAAANGLPFEFLKEGMI